MRPRLRAVERFELMLFLAKVHIGQGIGGQTEVPPAQTFVTQTVCEFVFRMSTCVHVLEV